MPAPTPWSRCAPAARSSCATATSRTTSGCRLTTCRVWSPQAAGYDIPETTEYSMYMWSYFEKFIILLKPENMATFMTRVFPEMMDAMPAGMKPMMLGMRRVPGGLAMMEKKMMPLMFPADGARHSRQGDAGYGPGSRDYIGEMPEDMAELMPDLLPKTMDSLMPTYLPELIPHLVPLFIDYIRTIDDEQAAAA